MDKTSKTKSLQILDKLANGATIGEILREDPALSHNDIKHAAKYGATLISEFADESTLINNQDVSNEKIYFPYTSETDLSKEANIQSGNKPISKFTSRGFEVSHRSVTATVCPIEWLDIWFDDSAPLGGNTKSGRSNTNPIKKWNDQIQWQTNFWLSGPKNNYGGHNRYKTQANNQNVGGIRLDTNLILESVFRSVAQNQFGEKSEDIINMLVNEAVK